MDTELLHLELRAAEGRTVAGVIVKYGTIANIGSLAEKFERGSLKIGEDLILNLQHDRGAPLARTGGGLTVTDDGDEVEFVAEIAPGPRGDQALADVKSGLLTGASAEFTVSDDEITGNLRTIRSAELVGMALVDNPAYEDSIIAMRAAMVKVPKPRLRYQI